MITIPPDTKVFLFRLGDDGGTIAEQEEFNPVEFGENAITRLESLYVHTEPGPAKAIISLAIELKKLQDNWPAMTLTEEA